MSRAVLKISKELQNLREGDNLSISAVCKESNVQKVRGLVLGPPDTPYAFGLFEFSLEFGKDFPMSPPKVHALTTNYGRTRFNPNIYACGKVCLSILGTWRGESGENWSPCQGIESVLLSIQSLMSGNPYENEPGFEDAHSPYDKKNQAAYIAKIRHETIRVSVIQRIERYLGIIPTLTKEPHVKKYIRGAELDEDLDDIARYEPFADRCKLRFLWYYDIYLEAVQKASSEQVDGTDFIEMPFESPGNTMRGQYQYDQLAVRLRAIKEALERETKRWADEGQDAMQKEKGTAVNIQRQFEQTKERMRKQPGVTVDLDLSDKRNPFVWNLILYGRPMTNLDGGIFRIEIRISPNFPAEQPRVKVLTPLFHHRITKDGYLCYVAREDVGLCDHVLAIIAAIEDETRVYDPRTFVRGEASQLLWGTPDEKKMYNRKLRRSVQDSAESFED